MIEQRINFYPLLERPGKDWLNSKFIAVASVLMMFSVGVIYVVLSSKQTALYNQLADIHSDIDIARKNANELRIAQQRSIDKSVFTQRIADLEAELALKRQVSHVLSLHPIQGGVGFTRHMEALGSHPIRGMWFTGISIEDGGKEIVLRGRVKKPDMVPQFLQALSVEPVFKGQEFSNLVIKPAEKENWLYDFELRTSPESGK